MPLNVPQTSRNDSYITGTPQHQTAPLGRIDEHEVPETFNTATERFEAVHRLATGISVDASLHAQDLFGPPADSLNPNNPSFDAKVWMNVFYNLHRQELGVPTSTSGIAFDRLSVHGYGSSTDFQKTVGNICLGAWSTLSRLFGNRGSKVQILTGFEGVLHSGEMLCVLGPPGSGSSTLLKTMAGEVLGLYLDEDSYVNYKGITPKEMRTQFRGEATYTAEDDAHLPHLSVGDTLQFAALSRSPKSIPGGISRAKYAQHLRDVVLAALGISHTRNTRVGDNFVRGVSGGERKRVSIGEALLSDAPLQCWDNSTRGLDSANAIEFCRSLRLCCDVFGNAAAVAIYQAPQAAYECFDKVVVLYQGRQIFFGPVDEAQEYFENLGFVCPSGSTVPDFLTSMTNPSERVVHPAFKKSAPRTSDDFALAWKTSQHRKRLQQEISDYKTAYPFHNQQVEAFTQARQQEKAKFQRSKSPYTLNYPQQIQLCVWRGLKLLKGDPTITLVQLVANFIQFLLLSSVFYNLDKTSDSLFHRGMVIFNSLILNAFASILEILTLYAKRRIVEKHSRYALYHPSAEALASMIVDLPYKILNAIIVNTTVYFMANLRRSPGPFFFFLLVNFFATLTMSMLFRFLGSSTKTASQALAPTAVVLLALVLFTGFSIPTRAMLGWSRWINYVNPLAWAFESLLINDLDGREFECSGLVPSGPDYASEPLTSRVCNVIGATFGSDFVSGTQHLIEAFDYSPSHKWRNFGILIAFLVFFLASTLITSEIVASARSKGEVLVFPRGGLPASLKSKRESDIENTNKQNGEDWGHPPASAPPKIPKQTSVFHWRNVCYDVQIKSETRRILDHVDGWIKPGTLTALMGVSGAGKTTLLDTLASRITMGVISGEMLVDGRLRDESFQRKTGYVQQQDLHLGTATVREALTFSALLRQPKSTPREEKLEYVEEVIALLDMQEYANAVIGEIGEGLNVEQRKRLTIGVELAAKPALLLFLDEPTSGLDSQTSWSICDLMEKLVKHGQAILCTIHQPSAMLFQRFDRLLLLAKGGKTVYFGEIGNGSKTLIEYFVNNGAPPCPPAANPAEWMLGVIGASRTSPKTDIDWPQVWRSSPEKVGVEAELDRLAALSSMSSQKPDANLSQSSDEFAAPLIDQIGIVTKRIFQQYWRSPAYIYSKAFLGIGSMFFIGFTFFQGKRTQQGLRSQLFGIFALFTTFMSFVEQTIPFFVISRSLYEVRERPSKTYSWKAFVVANILVEIPWNMAVATVMFIVWWFPSGLYNNTSVTDTTDSRATLAFLLVCTYMLQVSTFSALVIAGISSAEAASNIANVLGFVMLLFCGILAAPSFLPGFWMFMYRANPFTYLTEGLMAAGLARAPVECSTSEWLRFDAPRNLTCAEYMSAYIAEAGGYLANPDVQQSCQYCPISDTDSFLAAVGVRYEHRWRNFGIMWAFIVFNVVGAVFLYWAMRVPKRKRDVAVESGGSGVGAGVGVGDGDDKVVGQADGMAEKKEGA